MKNINIGVVNWIISNKLNESFNNDSLNESKKVVSDLVNIIKHSPLLQLEFKVMNNIENKHIDDTELAPRYIDKNIQLFEIYTIDELDDEHEKLKSLIESDININENEKLKLYNSIQTLIEETIKPTEDIEVDNYHEAYSVVLEHVKKPKKKNLDEQYDYINEEIIELATDKYNDKYSNLSSEEVDLLKKIIKSTNDEKMSLFEEYKQENVRILNQLREENDNEKINKSLEKINEMKFSVSDCDENIVKLYELKKGLE